MEIKDLKSQLVIVVGFLALSYLFDSDVLSYIALALGALFLISEMASKAILWLWWKIAHVLGWINTRILLSIVFYVILIPIATLSKIFKRDPLLIKWPGKGSSFVIRDHTFQPSDLENPW